MPRRGLVIGVAGLLGACGFAATALAQQGGDHTQRSMVRSAEQPGALAPPSLPALTPRAPAPAAAPSAAPAASPWIASGRRAPESPQAAVQPAAPVGGRMPITPPTEVRGVPMFQSQSPTSRAATTDRTVRGMQRRATLGGSRPARGTASPRPDTTSRHLVRPAGAVSSQGSAARGRGANHDTWRHRPYWSSPDTGAWWTPIAPPRYVNSFGLPPLTGELPQLTGELPQLTGELPNVSGGWADSVQSPSSEVLWFPPAYEMQQAPVGPSFFVPGLISNFGGADASANLDTPNPGAAASPIPGASAGTQSTAASNITPLPASGSRTSSGTGRAEDWAPTNPWVSGSPLQK